MAPLAIVLVLLSAVMHALRNYYTKKADDKQAFVWWYEIFGLLFFTPVFLFSIVRDGIPYSIPAGVICLSGMVHFVYWIFLSKALDKGDLSLVYPIMRSSPALVLIFSMVVFKEDVSRLGITGILLVACGVYTINMPKLAFSEMLRPLQSLVKDRATQFAFLTLVSVAVYSVVDKMGVDRIDPIVFAYVYPWISLGLFSVYMSRVKTKGTLNREWTLNRGSILVCGVLSIFGYFLILVAFTIERVSYIVGLRQLSIVFAVFLGGRLLNEKNWLIRITSSAIIFIGAYLIAVAG